MNQEEIFKKLIAHCKEYGFVFQSSEIYDGLSAVYDYGQYGVELKNNIKKYWWDSMTLLHENIVGIDSAIFMHPTVWKASGHVDAFNDPLIDNKDSKKRYRADVLIEEELKKLNKSLSTAQFALYGLGMKDYSNDLRLSPSLEFIRLIRERKYSCRFYDPLIPHDEPGRCLTLEELLEGADCLIILNRHHDDKIHQLDKIKKLMNNDPLIVDTRSWVDPVKAKKKGFHLCRC